MAKHWILLAAILVTSMVNGAISTAWTDPDTGIEWWYSVDDGEACVTGLGTTTGPITIPSTLGGCEVTSIGDWAFHDCDGLTSVTMPLSVKIIGNCAFRGCSGLTSLTIPSSVTSIGDWTFYDCSGLTSFTIPSSVKSIGDYAFENCIGLKSLTISEGVKIIGNYAFRDCSGLTSLTIPSSVKSIGDCAFSGCSGLTSLTIPSSLTSISACAFEGCSGLTSLVIPSSVEIIGEEAFYGCEGLTSLTIPSSVKSIGDYAFCRCYGLTSVTIPSSVKSIGDYAFEDCWGLASVTIAKGVISIGEMAFGSCYDLTSLTIPSSVTSIGDRAFGGCDGLGDGVVIVDGCVLTVNGDCPSEVTLPKGTRIIAGGAFYNCVDLTGITIPSSVTSIGNRAFDDCYGLGDGVVIVDGCVLTVNGDCPSEVTLPKGTRIIAGGAFADCADLTGITIPSSVTSIGDQAFSGCWKLTSVTIPPSVTSIGNGVFCSCDGLVSVSIPSSVKSIGEMAFECCYGLTSVTIPSSVKSIGDSAFEDCRGMTNLTISGGVESIGNYAFYGCAGLTSVTIPSSVTNLGEYAFCDCSGMTNLTISGGVTSIGDYAFEYCSGLMSLVIPSSVTNIGEGAFGYCAGLTSVTIPSSVMSIGDGAFHDWLELVYVRKGDVERVQGLYDWYDEITFVEFGPPVYYEVGTKYSIDTELIGYTAKGLPKGLKYDKKTGIISGVPTVATSGKVTVAFTKNGAATETIELEVGALPLGAAGTFNGFVASGDDETVNVGSVQATISDVGKITAKVVSADGSYSFSTTGWDSVSEGVYHVRMTDGKGDELVLDCDSGAAWNVHQLTGSFTLGRCDATALPVKAQKNAFGKQWYFNSEGDAENGWQLSYAESAKTAALTISFAADGKTTASGKLGTNKISASGYADVSGLTNGVIYADFAPVISVKIDKKTTKKVISLRTNLWFDRKNNHEEGVGFAVFAQ